MIGLRVTGWPITKVGELGDEDQRRGESSGKVGPVRDGREGREGREGSKVRYVR